MAGLRGLRTPEEVAKLRGLTISQVLGLSHPADGAAEILAGAAAPQDGSAPQSPDPAAQADAVTPEPQQTDSTTQAAPSEDAGASAPTIATAPDAESGS